MQETGRHNTGESTPNGRLVNLWDYKIKIALFWSALFFGTCILPIILYFVLKDVAKLPLSVAIGVPSGIFGGLSLITYFRRAWSLARRSSTTRPIGGARWAFDYFQYNFTLGFIYITTLICYATATKPVQVRLVALPLSILVLQVSVQLLGVYVMSLFGAPYVFTVSSMKKGTQPIRPAAYTIVEDTLAVDGGLGTCFRQAWNDRYEGSPTIRRLVGHLSIVWGCSGMAMSIALIVVISVLKNQDIGWVLGWAIPWVWALAMAILTIFWTKSALRYEAATDFGSSSREVGVEERAEVVRMSKPREIHSRAGS